MDTKEMHGQGECGGCGHGMGSMCCGNRHWMHIIIKVLVAVFIFWCGVQFGELKGLLHNGYMQYDNSGYTTGYGMMGGWAQ